MQKVFWQLPHSFNRRSFRVFVTYLDKKCHENLFTLVLTFNEWNDEYASNYSKVPRAWNICYDFVGVLRYLWCHIQDVAKKIPADSVSRLSNCFIAEYTSEESKFSKIFIGIWVDFFVEWIFCEMQTFSTTIIKLQSKASTKSIPELLKQSI